jgi:malonyl-CoA O-methyltransferase
LTQGRRVPYDSSMSLDAPLVLPAREGYDRWSGIYDGEDNPLILVEEPLAAQVLGDVRGLDVADIGCGTGRHALRLGAVGARVVALDFSAGMLAQARRKPGADAITFVEHDLARPLPLATAAFDRVVCGLVAEHIADLPLLFGELVRIARPGAYALVTIMHPAMMLKGVQARFVDPTSGQEVRPESARYLIADYVNAALRAGVGIAELFERSVSAELAARVPRAARYVGWPILFAMKLLAT